MTDIDAKLKALRKNIAATGGMVVAFSGGVDSTFLAAVARKQLGTRALAVTALSPTYPRREQDRAAKLAARLDIRHETVVSNELNIPGFAENPTNRCYFCKRELFRILRRVGTRHGILTIADGTNADDLGDYRPGRRAARELGVVSPLLEVGFTKAEIRKVSKEMGLPTADKPAMACLASRFPYGSRITQEKLAAVDRVEEGLRKMEFRQVRVRHHGEIARIEVDADEIPGFISEKTRSRVIRLAKRCGFRYVALDLEGYRTGSMNEGLRRRKP